MARRILITGGAGFIGSFLAEACVARGEQVRIFDNLEEQVHHGKIPNYLHKDAEFIHGDVRDQEALQKALEGIDIVFHLAAAVGVAQSQYEIKRYTDVNIGGTANLLDCIVNRKGPRPNILLPSSMTCYGEGLYTCHEHGNIRPGLRSLEQMEHQDWAPHCSHCKSVLEPIPTGEDAELHAGSIYALTKKVQEEMLHRVSRTYGIPFTILRLFNVYGPRQSLSNPYTGVTAIFLSRLKNRKPPVIYEDGKQSRDFVSVHDVVRAFLLAMENTEAEGHTLNIGSGKGTSILDVAKTLGTLLHVVIDPMITGEWRKNDIRHCIANALKAHEILRWEPQVSFDEGMKELVAWSEREGAVEDRFDEAETMLRAHKLIPAQ